MSGEEGLQGSWFTGTINQLQHGFALVAYDELNVSEDSDEKLQEWFPLPGAAEEDMGLLGPTHDAHLGPDFQIRPPPPAEVGQKQLPCILWATHALLLLEEINACTSPLSAKLVNVTYGHG